MRNQPLVSIIIPVYNRINCLKRAVDSVLSQTYPNWELIIVDDGSEEDIASYVNNIKKKVSHPVIFIRQENQGPGIARKNGLAAAKGLYVQYLDSDDEILQEKLSKQVALMKTEPSAVMCYCPTIHKSGNGRQGLRKFSDEYEPDLLKGALEWRRWHTSSCLWRYPDKNIANWTSYHNGEDVLHDVGVGVHARHVIYLPEALCVAHSGDGEERLSNFPIGKDKQERLKETVFMIKFECLKLLKEHQMANIKKYADPLSERFFHSGLALLKLKDLQRGIKSLGYSILTSSYWLRTIFSIWAILTFGFSIIGFSQYYRFLFLAYRKLTPESIHLRRGI